MALPENIIPADYDLTIYQGSDFSRTFLFKDQAGAVIDLTNVTAAAKVRAEFASTTELVEFSTVVTGAPGAVEISLTKAITTAMDNSGLSRSAKIGYWDLELTDASGRTERTHQGNGFLSNEATK